MDASTPSIYRLNVTFTDKNDGPVMGDFFVLAPSANKAALFVAVYFRHQGDLMMGVPLEVDEDEYVDPEAIWDYADLPEVTIH
jgi:hypothetical protein